MESRLARGPATHDVAFDSCAISRITSWGVVGQIRTRILTRGARLVIPCTVYAETANAACSAHNIARIDRMQLLARQLTAERFTIGADHHAVVQVRGPGPTPSAPVENVAALEFGVRQGGSRDVIAAFLAKDSTLAHDRASSRALVEAGENPDELKVQLRLDEMLDRIRVPGAFGLDEICSASPGLADRVRRLPAEHACAIYAARVFVIQAYGVLATPALRRDPGEGGLFRESLKKRKNDWVDARILAACACASWIVTDDAWMRRRADHLRRRYGFGPQPISFAEWLDGGSIATAA